MASPIETLQRTPLYAAHRQWGAKMVPFGGWEMPVHYTSILDEHMAVRERVGLFDVSHMGEVRVAGPDAVGMLNGLLTQDVRKVAVGQAQYSLLCNEAGGIIDDLILYRLEPAVYLLVINASNIAKDFAWMTTHARAGVALDNLSNQYAALALQGPAAPRLLSSATGVGHFHVAQTTVFGKSCWVARTGYTGEDGFEILCAATDAPALWAALLEQGRALGIRPCGLGARDTLRLEMCYPLHGQDLTAQTTPLEAGLGKFVALDKGEFIGRAALVAQKQDGINRKLVAFTMTGKTPPPRPHYRIVAGGQPVGEVTSGAPSPSLGIGIGMGYVAAAVATVGAKLEIDIRGKLFPAEIVSKPIWKKGS